MAQVDQDYVDMEDDSYFGVNHVSFVGLKGIFSGNQFREASNYLGSVSFQRQLVYMTPSIRHAAAYGQSASKPALGMKSLPTRCTVVSLLRQRTLTETAAIGRAP